MANKMLQFTASVGAGTAWARAGRGWTAPRDVCTLDLEKVKEGQKIEAPSAPKQCHSKQGFCFSSGRGEKIGSSARQKPEPGDLALIPPPSRNGHF